MPAFLVAYHAIRRAMADSFVQRLRRSAAISEKKQNPNIFYLREAGECHVRSQEGIPDVMFGVISYFWVSHSDSLASDNIIGV